MQLSQIKKRVMLEMRCNGVDISENDIVVHNNKDIFILGTAIGTVKGDVIYLDKDLAAKADKVINIAAALGRNVQISDLNKVMQAVSKKVLLKHMALNIDKAWS
jgi:hypothetical protein